MTKTTPAETDLRSVTEVAIRKLEAAIAHGAEAPAEEVADGVAAVMGVRSRMLEQARQRADLAEFLARANALASLADGTRHPLVGYHLHRLEQTRDGMEALLAKLQSEPPHIRGAA